MGAPAAAQSPPPSSRESDQGAGWGCRPGTYVRDMPPHPPRIFWFSARILWETRNDFLAKALGDPTDTSRERWTAGLSDEELTVDLGLRDFSFLLLGDTGEGCAPQYALIPALAAKGRDTAFMFICSDVLYPIGNVNDYVDKFYRPYTDYHSPIYAIPGNHDWYDGLEAFMRHFCNRPPLPATDDRMLSKEHVRDLLWHKPARFDPDTFVRGLEYRPHPRQRQPVPQRGPYYVIDTERLRLVGIDTGIKKDLDAAQGAWLLRVSAGSTKPKVILTGTPIYVNNLYQPLEIAGGGPPGFPTVDSIVRHPDHNYVAVIGGDLHNYQRYPVVVDGRRIEHIVSGGGGAFMHATHTIPRITPETCGGVTEDEFRCYPLRRDSLAMFSRLLDERFGGHGLFTLTPDEAATYLSERLGIAPTRPIGNAASRSLPRQLAAAGALLMPSGPRFHKWLSPFFAWDTPPFFKNFLRLDVSGRGLDISCYGVTGCLAHESEPALEDRVPTIPLAG